MLELSADRCRYAPRQAAALFCPLHFLGRSICICISYCDCKSIFIWICIHICNNVCISMFICIQNYDFNFICICVCIWICTRICNSISISICNCVLFFDKVPYKQLDLFVARSHNGLVAATQFKTKKSKYFYLYLCLSLYPYLYFHLLL